MTSMEFPSINMSFTYMTEGLRQHTSIFLCIGNEINLIYFWYLQWGAYFKLQRLFLSFQTIPSFSNSSNRSSFSINTSSLRNIKKENLHTYLIKIHVLIVLSCKQNSWSFHLHNKELMSSKCFYFNRALTIIHTLYLSFGCLMCSSTCKPIYTNTQLSSDNDISFHL